MWLSVCFFLSFIAAFNVSSGCLLLLICNLLIPCTIDVNGEQPGVAHQSKFPLSTFWQVEETSSDPPDEFPLAPCLFLATCSPFLLDLHWARGTTRREQETDRNCDDTISEKEAGGIRLLKKTKCAVRHSIYLRANGQLLFWSMAIPRWGVIADMPFLSLIFTLFSPTTSREVVAFVLFTFLLFCLPDYDEGSAWPLYATL